MGGAVYAVQERAWMDKAIMLRWVNDVLKPYLETAPIGVKLVLFLDLYCCHMMGTVVTAIQKLGIQVEHIPGGCTGLCQPIDVGINKPLKNWIWHLWENWMIDQGTAVIKFTPLLWRMIPRWVGTSLCNLLLELKRNSWRHAPYNIF